jgi:predicted AlkP superfamily pyrophosphatase or phosphodiesterase
MKICAFFLLLFLGLGSIAVQAEAETAKPPVAAHVVIVSIDGLRPDVALRADMPHLRGLMARGSFSFWANTTDVAITLPSHTSMLTGVKPEIHGIHWNADTPDAKPPYPLVPTVFELAKKQNHTTAVAAGKSKFRVFDAPGALDWKFIKEASDDEVASAAAGFISDHHPDLLFVHFPDCDRVGHHDGWGSAQQVAVVGLADQALGKVLDALNTSHLTDSTLIILSADHGGAGRTHGGLDPRSRHIPWVAAGPGVKHNYDLTLDIKLVINTEDTFATACDVLGIPLPQDIFGKPVMDIFQQRELLNAAP